MLMKSKYPGTCVKCGGRINVGDDIEWTRETGASHAECPCFEPPILKASDESVIQVLYCEGEYYSGYTVSCNDDAKSSLKNLGVIKYLNGWGTTIDAFYVERLGKEFTIGDVKKLVIPILEEKFNKERERKMLEAKTRRDKFSEAKRTGKPVVIKQWSEECNDPNEECDIDNVYVYAMPDGSTKKERHHTW